MTNYGPFTWPLTDRELVALCPIDGWLCSHREPQPRTIDDITVATRALAAQLEAAGEPHWADLVVNAVKPSRPEDRLGAIGHAVAIVLRRGPQAAYDRAVTEQLLVDVVSQWPQRPARTST